MITNDDYTPYGYACLLLLRTQAEWGWDGQCSGITFARYLALSLQFYQLASIVSRFIVLSLLVYPYPMMSYLRSGVLVP